MKELGCDECILQTQATNSNALKIYDKFGFTISGYMKEYYRPNNDDAIELTKKLRISQKVKGENKDNFIINSSELDEDIENISQENMTTKEVKRIYEIVRDSIDDIRML